MNYLRLLVLSFTLTLLPNLAHALEKVRVGVLEFGTVNWELDVMKEHKLAEANGFELEVVPVASADAATVALQGGAVDTVVTDWLWVAQQRVAGQDYVLFPYSNAVGSLLASPKANIKTLADLKGKKLGVAGGATDKSWLLLRAYAQQQDKLDLAKEATIQYGAPPLLNEVMQTGELDAVLNFWNFAARLQDEGLQTVITVPQVLEGLGIQKDLPMIGWVFSEKWAKEHTAAANGFLTASYAAKKIMKDSDEEWARIRPKMKADKESVFTALRDAFRAGIPACFGEKQQAAATQTFKLLAELGGKDLVGEVKELPQGVFYSGFSLPACP
ncbi:ABC transporter substrate-binding protein [uncultured Thiothrix sp.]|uniref:ABC transporter substrate-binding protein n=1 Tax=uncultured Thiothrix sp. TaxID=223185 RepID=UPI002612C320|nr:ABC transporter substrate-binding protein [uncultured Thiothrix sp.]